MKGSAKKTILFGALESLQAGLVSFFHAGNQGVVVLVLSSSQRCSRFLSRFTALALRGGGSGGDIGSGRV